MKSPDEILQMAQSYVIKHCEGKPNPLAVAAYIEGYTRAFDDYMNNYPTPAETEVMESDFEYFWTLYDKKVGKPKCIKLWDKLSQKDKRKCLDYIPLYKQSQPDKKYRKNPETFLRNKSWNDELIFTNEQRYNPEQQLQSVVSSLAEEVFGNQ